MTIEHQQPVVDFLMTPATHGGAAVERIDTHSAVVRHQHEQDPGVIRWHRLDAVPSAAVLEQARALVEA